MRSTVIRIAVFVVATSVASCGGANNALKAANLRIHVENGAGQHDYRVTCEPAGGTVPRPAELCRLLAEHADVMLLVPPDRATCAGGYQTIHLRVTGVFDGERMDAQEIDACQGNVEAERLWLSALPPPPEQP